MQRVGEAGIAAEVVEEGDPLVESQLRMLAQTKGMEVEILGQQGEASNRPARAGHNQQATYKS